MLIDISPPISSTLAVYPGDTPFRRVVNTSIVAGAEVSTISATSHLGAHVDAELHYKQGGRGVDQWPLDRFGDTDLPTHSRIAKHGMTILEGLQLAHVDPCQYELIALPLRIEGGDASPVRAVLRV